MVWIRYILSCDTKKKLGGLVKCGGKIVHTIRQIIWYNPMNLGGNFFNLMCNYQNTLSPFEILRIFLSTQHNIISIYEIFSHSKMLHPLLNLFHHISGQL